MEVLRVEYVSAGDIAARLAEGSAHGHNGRRFTSRRNRRLQQCHSSGQSTGFDKQMSLWQYRMDGLMSPMNDLADVAAEFR